MARICLIWRREKHTRCQTRVKLWRKKEFWKRLRDLSRKKEEGKGGEAGGERSLSQERRQLGGGTKKNIGNAARRETRAQGLLSAARWTWQFRIIMIEEEWARSCRDDLKKHDRKARESKQKEVPAGKSKDNRKVQKRAISTGTAHW